MAWEAEGEWFAQWRTVTCLPGRGWPAFVSSVCAAEALYLRLSQGRTRPLRSGRKRCTCHLRRNGPPPEGRDWRGRKVMEETMRVLTFTELMRLTRIELCALLTRITNELPDFPEGSAEREASLIHLRRSFSEPAPHCSNRHCYRLFWGPLFPKRFFNMQAVSCDKLLMLRSSGHVAESGRVWRCRICRTPARRSHHRKYSGTIFARGPARCAWRASHIRVPRGQFVAEHNRARCPGQRESRGACDRPHRPSRKAGGSHRPAARSWVRDGNRGK